MEFDHNNVRRVVLEDRLSSLPDELIHQILCCLDMKFAVQTCSLSSRWKFVWTSMPCLNFSSYHFSTLQKFAEFVTHVLSHRNHEIEVPSVKLNFHGAANQGYLRKTVNYAFSHNVQELTVNICPPYHNEDYPPCLFSSQSLKHFTLTCDYMPLCITPTTPWDFPALTTLHLSRIILAGDLFSKCVNLKNLTLKSFIVVEVEVVDIITPQLSNLMLIKGRCLKVMNVIAPQLENLTVIDCNLYNLSLPPGLSSLCYRGYHPWQLFKNSFHFHSLNKVAICLNYISTIRYVKEYARKTINMLQVLRSVKYLTLNANIVECISSFPYLLSHLPSPFSNLLCLTIDSSMRESACKVKMSAQAKSFLLGNSPTARFIIELPKGR